MKKVKILYTIPNFDTAGSGKVVYDLVNNLDKNKFEAEICCYHSKGMYFKEVEKLGVKIHLFPFTAEYKPYLTFFFRVLKIIRFFKKNQFDIIHSWHWSSDFSEPLAAKFAGIPFVYTKKAMSWGNKAWVWRSQLSTKVIYINDDMGTQFFSNMKKKAVQIPLGVDIDYFKPQQKVTPFGLNIDVKDFVIVSIANLVPVKGIEILLKAVVKLKDENIKTFIIGNDKNEYGRNLKTHFQSDYIKFLGKKSDVRPYIAMSDLFVIPTKNEGRKEGMPIAPMEAMAMGRIVIGSNISGINDILQGFPQNLIEPNNVEVLAQKILIIKETSMESKYSIEKEMRNYICANLSLQRMILNHENLYNNLL